MMNDMAGDTLVLMGCSATKKEGRGPALDIYDGPLWQTLRVYLGAVPRGNVCVLSAKYGFTGALTRIQPYDARLSAQAADYLIARGIHERNDHFGRIKPGTATGPSPYVEANGTLRGDGKWPYRTVIVAASGEYVRVFRHFRHAFVEAGLIEADAPVHTTTGGIGEQRAQLGFWLNHVNGKGIAAA
jgi:Family of unknown function (DUF6884)